MKLRRVSVVSIAAVSCAAASCIAPLFAAGPAVVFTKSFPGSTPAYVEITVQKDGSAVYKEDPKDEYPLQLQLSADEVETVFSLADKMGHFVHPLESAVKVANMGMKAFRYEDGAEKHEVKFNYSEDLDARALLDWFERVAETERNLVELERAVKFDKLGVQSAILRIEVSRDQKRLVEPKQFLPMLDRVAKNEGYLQMARTRAANLAESIRAPKSIP